MASGKSILLGSVVIGAAIIAAAYVWRGPPPPAVPTNAASAPPAALAKNGLGRYQIVRIENGVSWRLDTVTGEMTSCRMEGDRMICARSTEATELPKATAKDLEDMRRAEEQAEMERQEQRREEQTAMLDRFMNFFKWVIEQARNAGAADRTPSEPPPDDSAKPQTL